MLKISRWTVVCGNCACRTVGKGRKAIRVAFIEKTPRVRVETSDGSNSFVGWVYGPKGHGGQEGEPGCYGFHQPSRDWCDAMLRLLGYDLPEDSD